MRVVAVLIVLYFVSSVAFASDPYFDGSFGSAKPVDIGKAQADASAAVAAAEAATETSIKNSLGFINTNKVSDGTRSEADIKKTKIEIQGSSIIGMDGFDIQAKDLRKVTTAIGKQKVACEKACNDAIKAAEAAVKAISECESSKSTATPGSSESSKDCGDAKKAEADLQKAKAALAKCQTTHDDLMRIVNEMAGEADKAAAQAKKVKAASQGFGGGGGGGGGGSSGKDPKPGEVVVECLKGVAYMNPACVPFFKKYCQSMPDEPVCANWANHYCGLDFAPGSPRPHSDDLVCIVATPYYFCKVSGNAACQSCKDLPTVMATKQLPYYSIEQLVADREVCPNDPLLKLPSIIERLNAYDNSTPATGYQNQSLPPGRFK